MTAGSITALKSERDVLVEFREQLEKLATTLPSVIHSEEALKKELDDRVNDIFNKWQLEQASNTFSRKLFGEGALEEPAKLAQELVKSAIKPESATLILPTTASDPSEYPSTAWTTKTPRV